MKNKYRFLIIDDDCSEKEVLNGILKKVYPGSEITLCSSYDEGMEAIGSSHYHMALVDVQLGPGLEYNNIGKTGIEILAFLKKTKCSCYRILVSDYLAECRNIVFDAISPFFRTAQDVINKKTQGGSMSKQIKTIVDNIISININLKAEYSRESVDKLFERVKFPESVTRSTIDMELNYLFQKIFSDKSNLSNDGNKDEYIVEKIICHDLNEGRSRSIAFKVTPYKGNHKYNDVVIKIGETAEIKKEHSNYIKWVKWFKKYKSRTELIDFVVSDNISCIVYAFAGGAIGEYYSLNKILLDDEFSNSTIDDYKKVINDLFDPEHKEFYSQTWIKQGDCLKDFYYNDYFRDSFDSYQQKFRLWTSENSEISLVSGTREIDVLGVGRCHNPYELISGMKMIMKYHMCICHGDMIGNNILADEKYNYVIIDFAKTGYGPIELDFVTMEAFFRVILLKKTKINFFEFEKNLNKNFFESDEDSVKYQGMARICYSLIKNIRRLYCKNFNEKHSEAMYLSNSLFIALRYFSVDEFCKSQKMSLMAWALQAQKGLTGK